MARLHVQARAAGQCDSHCVVIDGHDLHHADDTNPAGYQQLTTNNYNKTLCKNTNLLEKQRRCMAAPCTRSYA